MSEQPSATATDPVVTLTPAAARRIAYLKQRGTEESVWVRLGVKGGGCSGLSYFIRLEPAPGPNDITYESAGIRITIDPKSARYLRGAILDFSVKNLLEGGWIWTNPNSARDCGCGTSFAPRRQGSA